MSENQRLPFRLRYLSSQYEKTRFLMEKKCRLTSELWDMHALDQLGFLYCEHLDMLVGDAFIEFYKKSTWYKSAAESDLAQCWQQLLKERKILRNVVKRWDRDFISHVSLLSRRLETDWEKIQARLGRQLGRVAEIDGGVSDIHQGKCVHIIRFQSGDRVVYKPRSLTLERKWQNFYGQMSQQAGLGDVRTPWLIERKRYGFEEFIPSMPVSGKEGFSLFYFRCGFLLGIAYVLQGTDLHAENMIACGDWPVLIDLETGVRACAASVMGKTKLSPEERYRFDSVMKTNLLPFLTAGGNICPGNDAFTASKIVFCNLPFDENGKQKGDDYVDSILSGFELAYDTVQKFGITEKFRGCRVRFLIQNTTDYAQYIGWIFSAEGTKNRKEFEKRLGCMEERFSHTCILLKQEKAALRRGYIPRLTVSLNRRCPEVKGMTLRRLLIQRGEALSEEDKLLQCKRIAVALNRNVPQDELYEACKKVWSEKKPQLEQIEMILEERVSFWEKLFFQDKTPEGILVANENHRYYLTNLPFPMLEGIPGLLPAFAAWYVLSKDMRAKNLAEQMLKELCQRLTKLNLNSYYRSFPEGLCDLLDMTRLVETFYFSPYLTEIQMMLLSVIEKEQCEKSEPEGSADTKDFADGLMGGMQGMLFPSFYRGEGGWLYQMQRAYAPELLPDVYEIKERR